MLDFNAELESINIRILELEKSIALQVRVLRRLSDRGMDRTLGERMLDVRRHNLRQTIARAGFIGSQIATRSRPMNVAERVTERTIELEDNLA